MLWLPECYLLLWRLVLRSEEYKMKLFKSIDEKLADIGFVRNDEDGICIYRRKDDKYG